MYGSAGVLDEPRLDPWVLVGGVVVDHQMQLHPRVGLRDLREEPQEPLGQALDYANPAWVACCSARPALYLQQQQRTAAGSRSPDDAGVRIAWPGAEHQLGLPDRRDVTPRTNDPSKRAAPSAWQSHRIELSTGAAAGHSGPERPDGPALLGDHFVLIASTPYESNISPLGSR